MDECKHVRQVKLAVDKSFLNPRNWSCCECGTTESVWVRQLYGPGPAEPTPQTMNILCTHRHVYCAAMWHVDEPVRSML